MLFPLKNIMNMLRNWLTASSNMFYFLDIYLLMLILSLFVVGLFVLEYHGCTSLSISCKSGCGLYSSINFMGATLLAAASFPLIYNKCFQFLMCLTQLNINLTFVFSVLQLLQGRGLSTINPSLLHCLILARVRRQKVAILLAFSIL